MPSITIELPDWLDEIQWAGTESDEERMAWVVALAAENVDRRTGGPFSAAVFGPSGLIAAGVNVVVESRNAIAHAEISIIGLSAPRYWFRCLLTRGNCYFGKRPCVCSHGFDNRRNGG